MRRLFSLLICVVATSSVLAQEICDDGLDNDNDGFIDCYDADCGGFAACDDIFVGNNGCQIPPPPAPAFTMQLDFSSPNETTNHFSRLVIGDLDRDGIPEIITMNKVTKQLFILNGNDGSIKEQATMANSASPEWEIATANIDDDNCAEIFFLGTDRRIYVYDCTLTFLYRTNAMPSDPINFGLADFDGDGLVEIYCKDQIYDAHSGRRLVATTFAGAWNNELNGGPVAVNMDADPQLELVLGLAIYDVNIPAGRGTDAGSLSAPITPPATAPQYFIRNSYNATSVADFNQDGVLDVIASGSTGCHGKNTTIFYWNRSANTVTTYSDHNSIPADSDYDNGWRNGTGRVNIADLDGDGQLNLSYVSGGFLYALKEDMTRLWRVSINEETSGYTGCTLFDFNGDGKSEIVYRDEQWLYIIDGTDGSKFNQQPCISRTNREYPIVADVDGDGSTEICVTCGFDDAASLANFYTNDYWRYSHVRVFKSAAEPWVPARRVWNQHGYFVVNVNDDLTIPRQQQEHHIEYPLGPEPCRPGDAHVEQKPLNKFLNQSPFINQYGCPAYSAPDIAFAGGVTVVPPLCPVLDFQFAFDITNLGDVEFSGDIPISFYTSNPEKAGATKLTTVTFTVNNLGTGDIFSVPLQNINSNGSDSLYVVLNDAGTTVPTPISLPNTPNIECAYSNILGIGIAPSPVALTAIALTEHENCAQPPTGSARAFVLTGGVENTADYFFYWFDGPVGGSKDTADFVGPIYTGMINGPFVVYAIHKTANCSSDSAQVNITLAAGSGLPPLTLSLVSDQTSCNPANGSLQATVGGPGGNTGFTFDWEDVGGPINFYGATLAGQQAGTYTVVASKNGCSATADGTIGDQTIDSDITVALTHIVACDNITSGAVAATASISGVPQPSGDYTFDWYFYDNTTSTRGSVLPPIHGSGPDRTGLPAGFYEVVATRNSTLCESTPVVVEILDNTVVVDITITELAPQTSCDLANPNGRLQASVTIGGVPQPDSDFTFEWFVGQNTLPANAHTTVSGTNGSIAEEVKGGGQSYTVRATNANQCFGIKDSVVTEIINLPVVTLAVSPNGICNPALASSNFTGSVTASVTFGGVPVVFPDANYSFEWYDGTQAIGAPRPENTSALTQLDSGYYTVVVRRTDLDCEAAPETEFVDNVTALPIILIEADSSTNCTPLVGGVLPNGVAVVAEVDGANPNPATHAFLWHDGIDTTSPIAGATNPNLGSLQGGVGEFYTVLVRNLSDGCQTTATVEIPDAQEKPIIQVVPSDNSICDPTIAGVSKNGSMLVQTVTYKGVPFAGALSYQWFNGVGTGTPNGSSTAATLPNLAAGFYSATVTLTATGCVSDFDSDEVEDALTLPTILTTPDPSTNCTGGTPNGEIAAAVDVGGVPTTAGFGFQWYTGTAITDPTVPNSPNNGNTSQAIQLQGGQDFTVEATNLSSGCKNTFTLLLQDDSEAPIITPLLFSPNLNCTAPFNGSASVVAATPFTYRGSTISAPYTGFTLVWSGGTVNAAGDGITALAAGPYTLQVTANDDNCISNPAPVTILDDLVFPIVDITETNQTSCDNSLPNGQLESIETSGTGTYSFDWYVGAVVGAPGTELAEVSDGLTTPVLVGGSPGTDYTVLVRNTNTRCETIQTTLLTDNITLPALLLLAASPVTDCANPNGSIDATPTVTSIADGDFTIFYLKENTTDPNVVKTDPDRFESSLTADIDRPDLGPGFFASMIRDEITHCESQVITVQVLDQTDPADITIDFVTNATFCGDNTGAIAVNVAGIAPPFTFTWHVGGATNMGPYDYINDEDGVYTPTFNPDVLPFPVTTEDLMNVTNGLYTLVVIDDRGCGAIFSESVPFVDEPTITISNTNSTQCDVLNGDGTITTDVNGINNYTIRLYLGLDLATAVLIDTDGPFALTANVTTTSLDPGDYLIEIMDNVIGCPVYKTLTVDVDARDPVITLGTITPNTSCTPGTDADGSVELTISQDPLDISNPALVEYQITAIAPVPLGGIPPSYGVGNTPVTDVLTGFAPLQYQITVTELTSGCSIDRFVTVPDQPVIPQLVQLDVTNDSFCAPNSNGSAEVITTNPIDIPDYEFSWYSSLALPPLYQANGGGGNGELFNSTKPGYTLGAPGQGTGNQTFFVRGERLAGTGAGAGCPTPAVQVVIQDEHVTPTLSLTSNPDTSCDPLIGEGSISVATVTNSLVPAVQNALYTYSINPDPNVVGLMTNQNGAISTPFTQLTDAAYTVTALNEVSLCLVNGTETIDPGTFSIAITDAVKNDKLICFVDGDITVTEITIDRSLTSQANEVFTTPLGPPPLVGADFEFRWFKNAPGTFTSGTPLADGTATVINTEAFVIGNGAGQFNDPTPTFGAGTYYVVARRSTGPGISGANCESVPLRVDIIDQSEDPVAALDPTTDTSCDGPFEGSISVLVTDPLPPVGLGYTYTWAALTAGRTPPATPLNPYDGNNNLFPLVEDGLYELTALNNLTGCISIATQVTVSKTAVPVVVANATHTDQLICNPPNGSITVVDVTVNGVIDGNHNNFNFMWYKDAVVPLTELVPFNPPSGNDVLDIGDLPMEAGTYFVKAQRVLGLPLGSGCESAPFRVDILDQSVDPDLDFAFRPDSSCNVLNPLGEILATASERSGPPDTYTFTWTYNGTPIGTPPSTNTTSQLNNAAAGNYTVTVTNTPTTGCSFTQGVTIVLDTTRSLPNIVNVVTVDPVNCRPLGEAHVVEVTVGGTSTFTAPNLNLPNFTYEWREGALPGVISTASDLVGQLPGIYFVSVTEVNTQCGSSSVEVVIDSASIIYPDVKTRQTSPHVICDVTLGGSASLVTTVDLALPVNSRNNLANYDLFWYPNLDTLGAQINPVSDTTITNQLAGNFSVKVFDRTTNCRAKAIFIIENDATEFKPILSLTSGPLTECDSIDGFIQARGVHINFPFNSNTPPADIYPFAYNYTADFYTGSPSDLNNPGPDLPGVPVTPGPPAETFLQPNLLPGLYTVRMTDVNTGCISVDTVSVKDVRIFPSPTAIVLAPVTNCDPLRPNGVAQASVNGAWVGYSFEWFEGTVPTGSPQYTGPQFDELKVTPQVYTVLATNLITGCSGSTQTSVSDSTLSIPTPTIVILSHVTSCDVNNPNGALSASVDGNTAGYIFDWYDGTAEIPPPDFTAEIYDSLAIGFYGVTATSRITGCKSPLELEEIILDQDFPDLEFAIQNATCGQSNGSASLIITTDIAIRDIEWFDMPFDVTPRTTIAEGPNLINVIAGQYSVLVTTILGCSSNKDLEISTEIRPFNGISRENNPGQNDYFHIDCIDNFPNNVVKIFNRAGTLVYEGHGYDNSETYFDGKSNKGVSPMGSNLPDGTYFFVVDKHNGSKPVAGYLEIVK